MNDNDTWTSELHHHCNAATTLSLHAVSSAAVNSRAVSTLSFHAGQFAVSLRCQFPPCTFAVSLRSQFPQLVPDV